MYSNKVILLPKVRNIAKTELLLQQEGKKKEKRKLFITKNIKNLLLHWCHRFLICVRKLFSATVQSKRWHQHGRVKVSSVPAEMALEFRLNNTCVTSKVRHFKCKGVMGENTAEAECLSCGIRDKRGAL